MYPEPEWETMILNLILKDIIAKFLRLDTKIAHLLTEPVCWGVGWGI